MNPIPTFQEPMNSITQTQHRLDSPKFGTFLFFPETPDTASVNIQFYAFDRSPHDVVIQFPATGKLANQVFTFIRSSTGTAHTFDRETAREIWEYLVTNGWSVNTAR